MKNPDLIVSIVQLSIDGAVKLASIVLLGYIARIIGRYLENRLRIVGAEPVILEARQQPADDAEDVQ